MPSRLVIFVLLLAAVVQAAFLQSTGCGLEKDPPLQPFMIDGALDEKNRKLKFFINSLVLDPTFNGTNRRNTSDPAYVELFDPVITDVDPFTNRYTTFHIEIDFMGKTFINENRRFCDMVLVKDTLAFQDGPRFNPPTPPSTNSSDHPTHTRVIFTTPLAQNRTEKNKSSDKIHRRGMLDYESLEDGDGDELPDVKQPTDPINLATSNASIEYIFDDLAEKLEHCPLFDGDSIMMYYEADVSKHFHRLGSYTVKFSVVSNNPNSDVIGCSKVYVTPVQSESISSALNIGIAVLLLFTGLVNSFTIVYSSYQESANPCLFQASTICNENLLKQLDATVPRIILYLQFALFIGGLDLQYPGFYQPLIGQIRWCALLGYNVINSSKGKRSVKSDNIYRTFNLGGLKRLTILSTDLSDHFSWGNFILCFVFWIIIQVASIQLFLGLKKVADYSVKKFNKNQAKESLLNDHDKVYKFTFMQNVCFLLGHVLESFLALFALPFLVLTCSVFYNSANVYGRHFFPNLTALENDAFSVTTPYQTMFEPYVLYYESKASNYTLPNIQGYMFNLTGFNDTGDMPDNPYNSSVGIIVSNYDSVPIPTTVFASLLFALWIGLVSFFIFNFLIDFKKWAIVANKKVSRLYTSIKTVMMWGFMYQTYHPGRLYFIISTTLSLVCKSIVIGCLQTSGLFQVAILIILEFLEVASLLIIRPNYVSLGRISAVWILPVARLLVTILCITYVRELGLSETTRTYIAYVQFVIHVVVALVFVIQLHYCLINTIFSIIKTKRERKQYEKYSYKKGKVHTLDDFQRGFEYKPVQIPVTPVNATPLPDMSVDNEEFNQFAYAQTGKKQDEGIFHENEEEEEDDDLYYRKASHIPRATIGRSGPTSLPDINETAEVEVASVGVASDSQSFRELQHYSNLRKQKNDYRVREGDYIYKKYFVDDSIDPEIKALWDARQDRNKNFNNQFQVHASMDSPYDKKDPNPGFSLSNILSLVKPKPQEKGFHVSRPRQLIVKKLPESLSSDQESNMNDYSSDHSYMDQESRSENMSRNEKFYNSSSDGS